MLKIKSIWNDQRIKNQVKNFQKYRNVLKKPELYLHFPRNQSKFALRTKSNDKNQIPLFVTQYLKHQGNKYQETDQEAIHILQSSWNIKPS